MPVADAFTWQGGLEPLVATFTDIHELTVRGDKRLQVLRLARFEGRHACIRQGARPFLPVRLLRHSRGPFLLLKNKTGWRRQCPARGNKKCREQIARGRSGREIPLPGLNHAKRQAA